jgi:methylase of polypeptide subunit release factors
MSEKRVTDWLGALGYRGAGGALITNVGEIGRRPYAAELRDLLDPDGSYKLDAVFLVENTPTVCFIQAVSVPDDVGVDQLRQRLWNQNLASALLVLNDSQLQAYSVPRWSTDESWQLLSFDDAVIDGPWAAVEFESSIIQRRLSDWFDPSKRVDRDLLRQLSIAVDRMTAGEDPPIKTQLAAQMVMAQVLFISYLEHRGIIGDDYRDAHGLQRFHDLIKSGHAGEVDKLLLQLKRDFNGDFLRPKEISWASLDTRALRVVDRFLSRVDLETGQRDFWNYDFSQIPVELLSGIYETFLQDKSKIDGAFYTPRVLAELAVEQAFESFDNLGDIRVFDGACGSGILLTTAFRKIVAYTEAANGEILDVRGRISLLQRTIFGSDINRIACRVTAFSLYLCILERLSPQDLTQLQSENDCKLPKLIGSNILEGRLRGDFFSSRNHFAYSNSFDVVISNPPWRELRDGEGRSAVRWAAANKVCMPHKQIAAAFASRAASAVKPEGKLVLLVPSSLISAPTNADFLRQFSVKVYIERIINLSDFRRLLFAKAEHACSILCARAVDPISNGTMEGKFQYWMPKVDISFAFNRLTLHDYDALEIPQIELVRGNDLLRRRSWGSSRDESLVQRLLQFHNLKDLKKARGLVAGKGYHMTDGEKKADPAPLNDFPFVDTKVLNSPSFVVDVSQLNTVPVDRGVASIGNLRMYEGPRVIWPDGTSVEIEVRAAYSDQPFCFNSAVGGIAFDQNDAKLAKFVTCYLRSSLAKYWLILNGYSAAVERARVSVSEIMSLPFIDPDQHRDKSLAQAALDKAASIIDSYSNLVGSAFAEANYEQLRDGVDDLVFDYFALSQHERALVNDMVELAATSLQPTSYEELFTPLQGEVSLKSTKAYLSQLKEGLVLWSRGRGGGGTIRTSKLSRAGSRTPLDVVHISLSADAAQGNVTADETASSLISRIEEHVADGHPLNFFSMPNSIFVLGNDIYIIKPARMRFWSRSAALRDADEVFSLIASNSVHTNKLGTAH